MLGDALNRVANTGFIKNKGNLVFMAWNQGPHVNAMTHVWFDTFRRHVSLPLSMHILYCRCIAFPEAETPPAALQITGGVSPE